MAYLDVSPYHALDDEENLTEKQDGGSGQPLLNNGILQVSPSRSWTPKLSCNVSGLILIMIAFMATIFLSVSGVYWHQNRDINLIKEASFFSPILDRTDATLHTRLTDATMFPDPKNSSHIFRLPPSDEVDAAWDRISNIGVHPITREDVIKLGKNPDEAIVPPDYWGLEGNYMVEVEVFHQIHCLNAMRKALITNYDRYWGQRFGLNPSLMFATHLNHCTDMILQALTCHADLDAITYIWREGQDKPFPDFATYKKCRNFDAILEWQESVQMPERDKKWDQIVKPADAKQLPVTPGLHELGEGTGVLDGIPTAPLDGLVGSLAHCRA